jgi:hypothetical protein
MKWSLFTVCSITLFVCYWAALAQQFNDITWYEYHDADGTYGVNRAISRAELLKIVLEATHADELWSGHAVFPTYKKLIGMLLIYVMQNNMLLSNDILIEQQNQITR